MVVLEELFAAEREGIVGTWSEILALSEDMVLHSPTWEPGVTDHGEDLTIALHPLAMSALMSAWVE